MTDPTSPSAGTDPHDRRIAQAVSAAICSLHHAGLLGTARLASLYEAARGLRADNPPAWRQALRHSIRQEAHRPAGSLERVRGRWQAELETEADRQLAAALVARLCAGVAASGPAAGRLASALQSLQAPSREARAAGP